VYAHVYTISVAETTGKGRLKAAICVATKQIRRKPLLVNPFVTSGTYTSHLQRVFSSPLG
jgi:hypothetical protein